MKLFRILELVQIGSWQIFWIKGRYIYRRYDVLEKAKLHGILWMRKHGLCKMEQGAYRNLLPEKEESHTEKAFQC